MIELHLHLDGSLRADTIAELAKREGVAYQKSDITAPVDCENLNDYLKCFDIPVKLLQSAKTIERAVYELCEDLKTDGVDIAEIRFAPQLHTLKGETQYTAAKAAVNAAKNAAVKCGVILCCMRGDNNVEQNKETLSVAKALGAPIDLAGAEALFKTSDFGYIFKNADGTPFTIHAGEADGAQSVAAALDFGAKRIGHGINSIESDKLVERLIKENVLLEICPTSNLQTKAAQDIRNHPIRRLFDSGVKVCINTDNRTVSNTTLKKEIQLLKNELNFTDKEISKTFEFAEEKLFYK